MDDEPIGPPTAGRPERPRIYRQRHYSVMLVVAAGFVAFRVLAVSGRAGPVRFNLMLFYILMGVGFYWAFALAGQFAFSQAAFAGVGAYASVWAVQRGLPVVVGIAFGVLFGAVLAALFAWLLRKSGAFYFGIATLALAEVVLIVVRRWTSLTNSIGGATTGIPDVRLFGYSFDTPTRVTVMMGAVVVIVLLGAVLIERSPARRDSVAVRDGEAVAAVLGVPVVRVRVTMFALGSATASLAGALLAHTTGFITPESFGLHAGVAVFVIIIVGGTHSLWGAVAGSVFYIYLPEVLKAIGLERWGEVAYGVALVAFMFFLPRGIVGLFSTVRSRVARLRAQPAVAAAAVAAAGTTHRDEREPSAQPALDLREISVSYGGVRAVDSVSLEVAAGRIHGLIGPNGSGKSTLLNAVSGLVRAQGRMTVYGTEVRAGQPSSRRRAGIARTFQTPQLYGELTCMENVLLADPDRRLTGVFGAWLGRPWMLRRERRRWARANNVLGRFGRAEDSQTPAAALSYGDRRMVEVARAVVAEPAVILLDEPSAGLNAQETRDLGERLRALGEEGHSMLLVDHKMDFISDLCSTLSVLELGTCIATGPPDEVLADDRVIDAYLGRAQAVD